jgi:hypothetical protein
MYSPESDLASQSKARRIYYQWSAGPAAGTSRTIPADAIVLSVEELHQVLKMAIEKFRTAYGTEREIRESVETHLPSLLCYVPSKGKTARTDTYF